MPRSAFFVVLACVAVCVVPALPLAAQVTDAEQRAALQKQLEEIDRQIQQNQGRLSEKQKERTSLERDVAILDAKIQAAQLGIKQRDLTIRKIKSDIALKERDIGALDSKAAAGEQSLAQILRQTQRIDDMSLVEIALAGSLSDVFRELDDFATIRERLDASFTEIAKVRSDLSEKKAALEESQQEESDMRELQVLQRQALQRNEKEKQALVTAAKGQEANYRKVISAQQQSAAQIRAALFQLRDSKSVSFGDMLSYAKEASAKTSVRPAVILGILAVESNLGQNIGTGNWKTDMHPTRDQPLFEAIVRELGRDPDATPVSKRAWYGWGGAMGPAQFIPSTWNQYRDRIAQLSGQNPPDPWSPRTAVFATAILMMDNGADAGTPAAERLAALRYLAGWKNATKPAYAFYGDDVMEFAAKYQSQIDILGG